MPAAIAVLRNPMSLFAASEAANRREAQPLAARMRPRSLDEFVGQRHFLGPGKLLRRLIEADRLGSVIFYGPPGSGKTTLANLLATATRSRFETLSAVDSGVKELRETLERARDQVAAGGPKTLLFVDEIHRFNRAQQDVLLPRVEDGSIVLVGATTQNPFFALDQRLGQPQPRVSVRAARRRRHQVATPAGLGRPRAGPRRRASDDRRRRARLPGRSVRWRRASRFERARSRRALMRRTTAPRHARPGRRVGAAQASGI